MMLAEQLDHIEEGLDTINNEMKQAERALKRMSKCCGLCLMPWQRCALAWLSRCQEVSSCQVTLPKEESQDMLIDLQEDQLSVLVVTMSSYQQSRKHYFRCCAYVNQS